MQACLDEGHQVILFINRRGYSTFVSCRACGYVERCNQCDVSMTYHQSDGMLHCHYCGDMRLPPKVCPSCGSRADVRGGRWECPTCGDSGSRR